MVTVSHVVAAVRRADEVGLRPAGREDAVADAGVDRLCLGRVTAEEHLADIARGESLGHFEPRVAAVDRPVEPVARRLLVPADSEDVVWIVGVDRHVRPHHHVERLRPRRAGIAADVDAFRRRRPHRRVVARVDAEHLHAALLIPRPVEAALPRRTAVGGLQNAHAVAAARRPVDHTAEGLLVAIDLAGAEVDRARIARRERDGRRRRHAEAGRDALPRGSAPLGPRRVHGAPGVRAPQPTARRAGPHRLRPLGVDGEHERPPAHVVRSTGLPPLVAPAPALGFERAARGDSFCHPLRWQFRSRVRPLGMSRTRAPRTPPTPGGGQGPSAQDGAARRRPLRGRR